MKKLKALLKSRRGVAIEFAIGVMFITVAVSTILFSVAIHEINAQKRDKDSFSHKLEVEQYAEEVLAYLVNNTPNSSVPWMSNNGYVDEPSSDNLTYKLKDDAPEDKLIIEISKIDKSSDEVEDDSNLKNVVLTVECTKVGNKFEITSWTWQ